MAQEQIKGQAGDLGSSGSLDVYDVPGSAIITPYAISATIDGSGAAGSFLPCLTFKTITGAVIARCPAPEVASGDTVEVSWFPRGGVGGGSGSGIQFDTDNEGGWLDVTANNQDGSGRGMRFDDTTGGGILLTSNAGLGGGVVNITSDGILMAGPQPLPGFNSGIFEISQVDGIIGIRNDSSLTLSLTSNGGAPNEFFGTGGTSINDSDGMVIEAGGLLPSVPANKGLLIQGHPADLIGFFGVTPVTQQAAPSSVAGIVAALQAYGLLASGGSPITSVGDVTSSDSSLTVTNPTGPTTDLAVAKADGGSA